MPPSFFASITIVLRSTNLFDTTTGLDFFLQGNAILSPGLSPTHGRYWTISRL